MIAISSRQSAVIQAFRKLERDSAYRKACGQFSADGGKLLREALRSGAEIETVLWKEKRDESFPVFPNEYLLPPDLFDYVSSQKNSPGPLFTVSFSESSFPSKPKQVLVLEGIQDPGNLGTILRTAEAFDIDGVILLEDCADPYSPKAVRATMGAVFRPRFRLMDRSTVSDFCREKGLPLWGAALRDDAVDILKVNLNHAAVAIGSEGRGLSKELLACCDGSLIIPMRGISESLNASVAAAVVLWEMQCGGARCTGSGSHN